MSAHLISPVDLVHTTDTFMPTPSRELAAIAAFVTAEGAAPGAVIAAAWLTHDARVHAHVGAAGLLEPEGQSMTPTTLFDLASVTKPATALVAARLARQGTLSLSDPLGKHLAEARETPSEHVSLELLLAHRAGLDGHRQLYAPLLRNEPVDRSAALREAALARREGCEGEPPSEGFAPCYSDLGYLLVGEALSRAAGSTLQALVGRELNAFTGASLRAAVELTQRERSLVAPTELAPFRGGVIRGEVHDENAWAMGGTAMCGHAGLFGDAGNVLSLGLCVLRALEGARGDWLSPEELLPLVRQRPGGTLRAGFDGKSPQGSSCGSFFSPRSIGHLGFTGTSLWIDPDARLVAVLLTNRVHPTRANDAIKRARPAVHDALWRWAQSQTAQAQR